MILHSRVSDDGGGGGGNVTYNLSRRPTRTEKLYNCSQSIYIYNDGRVEIDKSIGGVVGEDIKLNKLIPIFTKIIANAKLRDTNLDMFKEGLSELLQEAVQNILEGEHYERAICTTSTRNGSDCNRST